MSEKLTKEQILEKFNDMLDENLENHKETLIDIREDLIMNYGDDVVRIMENSINHATGFNDRLKSVIRDVFLNDGVNKDETSPEV